MYGTSSEISAIAYKQNQHVLEHNEQIVVVARLPLIGKLLRMAPSTWEVNIPSEGVHFFQSSLPGHSFGL